MSDVEPSAPTCSEKISESSTLYDACNMSMRTVAIECCAEVILENRKRRPRERGKKRKKVRRNPVRLLWSTAHAKNRSFRHVSERN